MANRRAVLGLLLSLSCPVAWAQNPAGAEFQVNSYTTNAQRVPAVASDANGNFVVVWESYGPDGSRSGVFAQRFSAVGLPQGSEFQVNSYTTNAQRAPAVASDANGNFVVVWSSGIQDGSAYGVFGQRFNAAGLPQGSEFQVNSYTTSWQGGPAVASDANGNFVVVWQSYGQDGSAFGVFGQRFNAAGLPQGSEFQVNSYTTSTQLDASVASAANGNFVVVWTSAGQDGSYGVFGQRFHALGAPQGSEFQVNSYTTNAQRTPAVASDANGNFVVVWASRYQDGSGDGVFGQRFNAAGLPQGSEFQVSSYTAGDGSYPAVASDANGDFVVVWESYGRDGSQFGVFGQRFNAGGLPQDAEFQVNSYTTSWQTGSAVASDANGDFVVVWESYGQDGSHYGIFGQRYRAAGQAFHTVAPCRAVDTRSPAPGTPLAAGVPRTFAVTGTCGIPLTARAVSLNIAVTGATNSGNVRLYPGGTTTPTVSTVNFTAGVTRANNAITLLGTNGDIAALLSPAGSVHVIIDVNGYME
jgi:hypothetical protein